MVFRKMMKTTSSRAMIMRINLVFLAFFFILYSILLLCPSASDYQASSLVRCSLRECRHKIENGVKMKSVLEEEDRAASSRRELIKTEKPSFLTSIGTNLRIGTVNMDDEDMSEWSAHGEVITVSFSRVSPLLEWKDLFPEWIDEEEEEDSPSCPEIPMPDFDRVGPLDIVVAKLPCREAEAAAWKRDVARLQVHLIAANLAARRGRGELKVVLLDKCTPMMEIFRCDEMIGKEADWWIYRPELGKLEQKVSLPVGSCNLALPLRGKDVGKSLSGKSGGGRRREAYATVLHSSEVYVCGAIVLAQSLLRTGTRRDLILLLDGSVSESKREALARAGWKILFIDRIRNPKAERKSYNEYNYSKFRLWQLTDYDKIVFIDSDIIVLRNLDVLFDYPQMSATGNDGWIFNSGIMVIEPSNCTFRTLMSRREEIVSYNGGDQGFLNEVFVWWHRLPRRVNFLKNFWSNTSGEVVVKEKMFGSDPPELYSIHYLGSKPWLCYRDYDCNWDVPDRRVYASDVAHARWWRLHDGMEEGLKGFCRLPEWRKRELEQDRKRAGKLGLKDRHWRINVTDPRKFI